MNTVDPHAPALDPFPGHHHPLPLSVHSISRSKITRCPCNFPLFFLTRLCRHGKKFVIGLSLRGCSVPVVWVWSRSSLGGGLGHDLGVAGVLGLALLEAILETARDVLQVAHAAGADSLSPLGLLAPVDCLCRWSVALSHRQGGSPSIVQEDVDIHFRVLAAGKPQEEHSDFWTWYERRPKKVCPRQQKIVPAKEATASQSPNPSS